jgi:hypothetical protein
MDSKDKPDDELGPLRDAVAELRLEGSVVEHLATQVERFWGVGGRQERVWLLITWTNERRERIEEDYPPWTLVEEVRGGSLRWTVDGQQVELDVAWLRGDQSREALRRYGIREPVGHYR